MKKAGRAPAPAIIEAVTAVVEDVVDESTSCSPASDPVIGASLFCNVVSDPVVRVGTPHLIAPSSKPNKENQTSVTATAQEKGM